MKFLILLIVGLISVSAYSQEEYNPDQLTIDGFECLGNDSTDCDIIEREIYLHPGDKINEDELQSAKIRLQLLALFKDVNLRLKKGTERGHVIVQIEVHEDDPYFTEFNSEYYLGNKDLLSSFKLGNRNVFGRGKILQGSVGVGRVFDDVNRFKNGRLEYIDPHLWGTKRNYFKSSLDYYTRDLPKFPTGFAYTKERFAGSLDFGRRIYDFSYLQIGFTQYQAVTSYHPAYGGGLRDETFQGGAYRLSYGWNSEDDPYFPTQGSKFDVTYNLSSTRPDLDHGFTTFNYKKNWSLAANHVLVGSFFGSFSSGTYSGLWGLPGIQYVYQPRRFQSSKEIYDFRFFIGNEVGFTTSRSSYYGLTYLPKVGVLFNSKTLGIVQLKLFAGDLQ